MCIAETINEDLSIGKLYGKTIENKVILGWLCYGDIKWTEPLQGKIPWRVSMFVVITFYGFMIAEILSIS
jgi:hypothetical protein